MPKTETSKSSPAKKGGAKGQGLSREVQPSSELSAIVGSAGMPRTEITTKVWDYIKANGLQDATNKRAINADAKLLPVFGKPQVTMFELAGLVGKHLSAP